MRDCGDNKEVNWKLSFQTHWIFPNVPQLRPWHTKDFLSKGDFGIGIFTQNTYINKQTRHTSESRMSHLITMIVLPSCVAAGVETSNSNFWFFIQVLYFCAVYCHTSKVKRPFYGSWPPTNHLTSSTVITLPDGSLVVLALMWLKKRLIITCKQIQLCDARRKKCGGRDCVTVAYCIGTLS